MEGREDTPPGGPSLGAGLSAPPWLSTRGWAPAPAPAPSPPGLSPISVLGAARPVPSVLGVTGYLRKRKGVTPFLHSNCLRPPGAMPASPASTGAQPTAVPRESGLHFQLSTWAPGCGRTSSPRNRGDCGRPSLLTVLGPSALTQAPLKPTPRPPPLPWCEWPAQIHSILSHLSPCFLVETLGPLRKGRPGPRTKFASRHLEKTQPLQDWTECHPLLPPAPLLTASVEQTPCFSAQPHFRAEVRPRPPFLDEGDHRVLSSVFVLRSCLGTRNKARGAEAGRGHAVCVCVSRSGRLPPSHLLRQLRGAYLCARLVSASLLRDLRVGKWEAG